MAEGLTAAEGGALTIPAVLAIGASTGGPPVVEDILRALPADFHLPVVACVHMPEGFTGPWAARLDRLCAVEVREAADGEPLRRGVAHVCPVGSHVTVARDGRTVHFRFDAPEEGEIFVPSIDRLMTSVAATYRSGAVGVILTGLGSDGAKGLLAIRTAGGHTIAERPDTALAASMPQSAVEIGAAMEICGADEMPALVLRRTDWGHVED